MTTPSLLVHIRHGHAPSFFPGKSDREIPLSDEGLAHAKRVGLRLAERFGTFDQVIHSTYLRSRQTAYAQLNAYSFGEISKMVVREDPLLDERNLGAVYGLDPAEVEKRFPELAAHWQQERELRARYPEGNRLLDVVENVSQLLGTLPKGKRVLLCGHWGTHWSLRYLLEGLSEDDLLRAMAEEHPENCSLLIFEPADGKLVLREKNIMLSP